jgi:hypothetical protein
MPCNAQESQNEAFHFGSWSSTIDCILSRYLFYYNSTNSKIHEKIDPQGLHSLSRDIHAEV